MSYWSKYPNIQEEMDKVEKLLEQTLKSRRKIVQESSLDLLKAGGKRIRPALTIISAQFGNYNSDKIVPLAAALEIFHMATLIHDDIIDNAKTRRGIETVHSKYGSDIAVYTGDYLFSKAFLLVSKVDDGKRILQLSKFIKSICEGEIEQHTSKFDTSSSIATYLKRIKYKTAILFALCCQVGAEAAECNPSIVRSLRRYGMSLGTAFQIKDDLLDLTAEEKIIGKPAGNDILEGVYTLPLLYTIGKGVYTKEVLDLLKQSHLGASDVFEIIQYIRKSDAITYSENLENRHYDRAIKSLKNLSHHPNSEILLELVNQMKNRIK